MQSIEKNDIDISKLFTWGKEVELFDSQNLPVVKIYIRLVGDENLNRARVYGLRKSAELRKKLRQEGSDERMAYVPDREIVRKENVVEQLLLFKIREYTTKALNELRFNIPKEPDSDAPLEEMEKYQENIDEFPKTREQQIREHVNKLVELDRQRLNSTEDKLILDEYEDHVIDQLCELEMVQKFREMCVFYGTFADKEFKKRLFDSIDEMLSYPTDIKNQLLEAYSSLEFGGEEIKK